MVTLLENEPDDLNIGWTISDAVRDAIISDVRDESTLPMKLRFARALKAKTTTGKGYFWKSDAANRKLPVYYPMKNKASNLCVAPETRILTEEYGYVAIKDVVGTKVHVWNGEQFSPTVPSVTSPTPTKLLKVVTNFSRPIYCTPEHKFYVAEGYTGKYVEKRASELSVADRLIKFDLPVIEGDQVADLYADGFFSGDGCEYNGNRMIYLYNTKMDLLDKFEGKYKSKSYGDDRVVLHRCDVGAKFTVPGVDYTVASRLSWLAGLLDSDGTVSRNGSNESFQIATVNQEFAYQIQEMLQTLGVNAKVSLAREAGEFPLPANDGSGLNNMYQCKEVYRILISSTGVHILKSLGLVTHRLKFEGGKPQRSAEQFVQVVDVLDEGREDITMCFTENLRHMGMFNGVLTGQCSEINLPSDENHTFTCVLSSMNLAKWDEWKDTDAAFNAAVFLDCVASEFIMQARGVPGLEKAVRFTEKARALGLGVCGFHTYLQEHMIPFESMDAMMFNDEAFSRIKSEADRASLWMGEAWGVPEWIHNYRTEDGESVVRRNASLIAIAPTKSTALIMGGVSEGINPDVGFTYTQGTAAGEINRVSPVILRLMKERGVYDNKHIKQITGAFGSVQGVDWLSDEEKKVFKTAFEINQYAVLRLASQRAKYIDQWQSLNLFFAGDAPSSYIAGVHKEALADDNILGLYYLYSMSGVAGSDPEACEACQ